MSDDPEEQKQIDDAEKAVEQWKVKKLIHTLEAAKGNGTSMISLIIPPKDQVSRIAKMLGDEFGTASNIKSRVNRLSVLGAITSVQQRLKLFNRIPTNGLVIYCGTVLTLEGKEKKVAIDFEPFKPINTSLYMCDNKFHTEALNELLESDEKFGFIIMDGNGCLFGTLAGSTRAIIHKFSVDLPKKHGRGGQSALRFARLRLEKRHNYLRKVAEMATTCFISQDRPNVTGLILAGSAEFKTKLNGSDLFDPRLAVIVQKIVDVSYGGENGFNQAIELAADALANVKFIREKKLLTIYFGEIAKESGRYCLSTDTRLLTSDGYLFLYEIEGRLATGSKLDVASFDDVNERVVYTPLTADNLIVNAAKVQSLVRFEREDAGMDLLVTADHDMYVQSDNKSYAKCKAGTLLPIACDCADLACVHRRASLQFKTGAVNGVVVNEQLVKDLESELGSALGVKPDQIDTFLELYGYWIGVGSLQRGAASTIDFSPVKSSDKAFVQQSFDKLGFTLGQHYNKFDLASGQTTWSINEPAWVAYFVAEYGRDARVDTSIKSAKCLLSWVFNKLDRDRCRLVLEGLRRADGSCTVGEHGDVKQVFTSSIPLREEITLLAVLAGYSTTFSLVKAGTQRGAGSDDKPILATHDSWCVNYNSHLVQIVPRTGVSKQSKYNDRTWCVSVPTGLIIVQRAEVDDTGRVIGASRSTVVGNCFGVKDTLQALDLGSVEELIVWEQLDINRIVLKHKDSGEEKIVYLNERQEKDPKNFKAEDGGDLEIIDKQTLLEWLANNFKNFGAKLQFVTDKSQEGSQFCRGFGGIGGLLRYQVDFLTMEVEEVSDDDDGFM